MLDDLRPPDRGRCSCSFDPIVYEDFLPVSAAGIFQSNLGDDAAQDFVASPNQQRFEADLGATVLDEFDALCRRSNRRRSPNAFASCFDNASTAAE